MRLLRPVLAMLLPLAAAAAARAQVSLPSLFDGSLTYNPSSGVLSVTPGSATQLGGYTVSTGLMSTSGALSVIYGRGPGTALQGNDPAVGLALSALQPTPNASGFVLLADGTKVSLGNLQVAGGALLAPSSNGATYAASGDGLVLNSGVFSLAFAGGVAAPALLPKSDATGSYFDLRDLPTLLAIGVNSGQARDAGLAIAAETTANNAAQAANQLAQAAATPASVATAVGTEKDRAQTAEATLQPKSSAVTIGVTANTARDAAAAIAAETSAAQGVQAANNAISSETQRAETAENSEAANLVTETQRAQTAEAGEVAKAAMFAGLPLGSAPTPAQVLTAIGAVAGTPGDTTHLLLASGAPVGLGNLTLVNGALVAPGSAGSGAQGPAGQGFTFRGAWAAGAAYSAYDVLTYGGQTYVVVTPFTSGGGFSTANLTLLAQAGAQGPAGTPGPTGATGSTGPAGATGATGPAGTAGAAGQGFTFRGAWAASTAYSAYDVLTYGGQTYMVVTPFTSGGSFSAGNLAILSQAGAQGPAGITGAAGATGPAGSPGQAGATGAAGQGFTYRGGWAASTAYSAYDVLTYGGQTYLVTTAFTSGASFSAANLALWAQAGAQGPAGAAGAAGASGQGFTFRGAWAATTAYNAYDVLTYGGQTYLVTTAFTSGASFSATNLALWAQAGATGPQGPAGSSSGSSGAIAANTLYDCRWFGCQATGSLVTVQSKLGITSAAALQAYALPTGNPYAGATPYAGINNGNWTHYAAFQLLGASASGTTALTFGKTVTVSVASTSANPSQIILAAGGLNGVRPGLILAPSGNSDFSGTLTVSSVSPQGTDGNNNSFFLSANATTPPAAGHVFTLLEPLAPLSAALAAGKTVHAYGNGIAAGATVSAVNTSTGAVTLSTALTGATTVFDGVEFTWSYTDAEVASMSMDTLGVQAALNYAAAQGGGAVLLPGGTLESNQTIVLPTGSQQGSGTVDLRGASMNGSTIVSATDLGLGQYAMTCPLRLTGGNNCAGQASDFSLASANTHYAAGGASSTLMSGFGWSGRRTLSRINVQSFQTGVAITGDQTHFDGVIGFGNYYGLYWDYNNTYNSHDNHLLTRVIFGNNEMAALAVGPNVVINGTRFESFTDGAGPFGFYKETGGTQPDLFSDVILNDTQCEQPGIACRGEDRPWLQQVSADNNTRYEFLEWGAYNSFFAPPGGEGNTTSVFAEATMAHVYVSPYDAFNWIPGAQALFNVANGSFGVTFEGDIESVLTASGGVAGNIFGPAMGSNSYGWTLRDRAWEAHLASFSVSGVTPQRLVCIHEVSPGTSQLVNNCSGDSGDDTQGVLIQTGTINPAISILVHRGDIDTQSVGFQLPKTTPNGSSFASNYQPQVACTASGGGIQPGVGRSCPNGGSVVGAVFRGDGNNSFMHLNVGTW